MLFFLCSVARFSTVCYTLNCHLFDICLTLYQIYCQAFTKKGNIGLLWPRSRSSSVSWLFPLIHCSCWSKKRQWFHAQWVAQLRCWRKKTLLVFFGFYFIFHDCLFSHLLGNIKSKYPDRVFLCSWVIGINRSNRSCWHEKEPFIGRHWDSIISLYLPYYFLKDQCQTLPETRQKIYVDSWFYLLWPFKIVARLFQSLLPSKKRQNKRKWP